MPRRGRRARGQTLAEFALVAPLFLIVVFASIDFGGYFGSRLSVEEAARVGARFAAVQPCLINGSTSATTCNDSVWSGAAPPGSQTIEGTIIAAASYPVTVPNVDCWWSPTGAAGSFAAPSNSNPPGETPSAVPEIPPGDSGCIAIAYISTTQSSSGPPGTTCAFWTVAATNGSPTFTTPSSSGVQYTTASCVTPGDLVQVTVMYRYSALTPLPALPSSALVTTATVQVLEED